jgi:hypothetical protein
MNMQATIEEQRSLCGPFRDTITRTVGAISSVMHGRLRSDGVIIKLTIQLWNVTQQATVTTEAEESPLLRSVTRKRLRRLKVCSSDS